MPTCVERSCTRWRPERLTPAGAAGIRVNGLWYCSRGCVEQSVLRVLVEGLASQVVSRHGRQPSGAASVADVTTVGQVDEAAALVADAASMQRAVTMRHARWERCMWVQIEGPTQVSNLLVPTMMEGTCQVAHTQP